MRTWKDISTGRDNETKEIVRVLTLVTFGIFNGMSIYQLITKGIFEPWQYVASSMTIIAGVAGALRMKEGLRTAPKMEE